MEARFREMREKKAVLQKDLDSMVKQMKDAKNESASLESRLRMANEKLAKTSKELETQQHTSKTLQERLDESDVQLRAKTKACKDLSESLVKAERDRKEIEVAMQKTVCESTYRELQNDAQAQKIEYEAKKRELEAVQGENEKLQKTNTQLAARSVQGFWRRMNVQTVPMINHLKVLEDAGDAKQKLSLEKKQREALENRYATLQSKVHQLNEENASLKAVLEDKAPKTQLLEAHEELERARQELSMKDMELSRSADATADTEKQLQAAKVALEELKGASVTRDEHLQLRASLSDCQVSLESKSAALEKQRELYGQLQRRLQELQQSYDTATAASTNRADLEDAFAKIKALERRNTSLDTELRQERLKHAEFLKGLQSTNDLKSFKGQIEQLKARLEKSAPKEHLVAAKRSVKALQDENIFLKTQNGNMRTLLVTQGNIVKSQLKDMEEFMLEASTMVPESEIARLNTHIMQSESKMEALRLEKDRFEKAISEGQMRETDLQEKMMSLEERMNHLVKRELWEEAGSETRRYKGEVDNLRVEVTAMEEQTKSLQAMLVDMVPSADLEEVRNALQIAESEVRQFKRLLAQAGLSELGLLAKFVEAVVGPPHHDIQEVIDLLLAIRSSTECGLEQLMLFISNIDDMSITLAQVVRLLQALQGPPKRSPHDICTVVHALNGSDEEPAWQSSEILQLLRVMRQHPKLRVAELGEILARCGSMNELQRLYESICMNPEAHGHHHHGRGGIGLLLEQASKRDGGGHYIKEVVEDGPAAMDARIRVGDQVMFIDGEDVCAKPLHLVTALLRGAPGSSVEIVMIQADYRTDKRVHPNSLPAVAWYTVSLTREESQYYDIAFAKEVLQMSPSPVEEPAVDLWESFSMGIEDISNVVWPANSAPSAASQPRSSRPHSAGAWFDTSVATASHESTVENFPDFRRTPGKFVPAGSYITAPGSYRTASMDCDLVAM